MKKTYLYAARDTVTKKLVSDITNPKWKYWDKRGNAQAAIDNYNKYYGKGRHNTIELVVFELVEIEGE